MAVVAAFADVDVAPGELQRRVGLQPRDRLGHRLLERKRHDFDQAADRDDRDHEDDEERLVALDEVVGELHAGWGIIASTGLAMVTVLNTFQAMMSMPEK